MVLLFLSIPEETRSSLSGSDFVFDRATEAEPQETQLKVCQRLNKRAAPLPSK